MIRLSVILPAYNEINRLPGAVTAIVSYLRSFGMTWEVIIVSNGSTDGTEALAARYASAFDHVYAIRSRRGKGAAVRAGMLHARGAWRYMCDCDLSTPIAVLPRFMAMMPYAPVVIGSREAAGASREGEPGRRHVMGRVFNGITQALVPGIADTQCGFKMFSSDAAETIFSRVTVDGFAFDVEALYLARWMGLRVLPVGVPWRYDPDSRVRPGRDAVQMVWDVLKIRFRAINGEYGPKQTPETAPVRFTP